MQTVNKILAIILLIFVLSCAGYAFECGNAVCDITETQYTCSKDCKSGGEDSYCDGNKDAVCDPDCINDDPDCPNYTPSITVAKADNGPNPLIILGAISFIIIFLIIILVKVIKQHPKDYLVRETKQVQEPQQLQPDSSNPFERYKYMYKK
ncbi:MAG: hypothetical protein ABIG95_01190 [Candidatus Woesearchaeota archaeon]